MLLDRAPGYNPPRDAEGLAAADRFAEDLVGMLISRVEQDEQEEQEEQEDDDSCLDRFGFQRLKV